jgi:hypothetical protein
LITAAGSVGCFLVSFAVNLLIHGTAGAAPNRPGIALSFKIGVPALLLVVAMILAVRGIEAVKTRTLWSLWQVTTGPLAVGAGMFMAISGGLLGGMVAYGLLFVLIRGH